MKKHFWIFGALSLVLIFSRPAVTEAHSLWIEKDTGGDLSVCFGEYDKGLREQTGQKLDKISHLESWAIQNGKRIALTSGKTKDRLGLNVRGGDVIVQDVNLAVRTGADHEKKEGMSQAPAASAKPTRPYLYARFAGETQASLKPELTLDMIPSAENADRVQVFFEGLPLPDQKVELVGPNGWAKTFKSDQDGWITMERPWPGLYVAETTYTAAKAGRLGDKDYESERHHMALSIEKIIKES